MLIHINKSWDFITAEPKHIFIKTWPSIDFMSVLIILIKVRGESDDTCRAYKNDKNSSLAPLSSNRPLK